MEPSVAQSIATEATGTTARRVPQQPAPPTARQTEQNRRSCLTAEDKPPVPRATSKHASSVRTTAKAKKIAKATEPSVAQSIATEAAGTTAQRVPQQPAPPTARQTEQNRRPCLTAEDKPPVPRAPSKHARSIRTTASHAKAKKIAKAKEELARLQVELAQARLAALELEESDEEDAASVYSGMEADTRINTWLDNHEQQADKKKENNEQPPLQAQPSPAGVGPQTDFSQLASAITLAVKAARPPRFIELPIFNGSHQEWLSFQAAFNETMNSFTHVENMNRLRRNLKGRAKEAVDSLLIANADPTVVMKTLESRFGRPEAIAMSEVDTHKSLPRLTESPRDICIFSSKVTNAVSTLRALKSIHYLYNPEAAKTMIEKLTPTQRYRYYDFAASQPKEEADLQKIESFLKKEAELCAPYAQPEQVDTAHTTHNRRTHNVHTDTTEKQSTVNKCPVCDSTSHAAIDCETFKNSDQDSRWVREYRPELRHRQEPHDRGPAIKVGDLVQLIDPNLPRSTWARGRVIATYPGPDDIVRTADIKTRGGVLRRPVRQMVILPIEDVDPAPVSDATKLHGGSNVQDDGTSVI